MLKTIEVRLVCEEAGMPPTFYKQESEEIVPVIDFSLACEESDLSPQEIADLIDSYKEEEVAGTEVVNLVDEEGRIFVALVQS